MELQLKNIGMIKKANVKIDGLTVIAGENDTGKSTVGKALYLVITHIKHIVAIESVWDYFTIFKQKDFFKDNGKIVLNTEKNCYTIFPIYSKIQEPYTKNNDENLFPIMIESPLVWNFTDFFRDIAQVESQMNIKLDYPYLMKDLNFKLHIKSSYKGLDIKEKVITLMGGEFKKDESDHYYFDKNGQRIELVNTATGIKQFAIFQILSQNGWLNKDTVLILDEPEVHLHPKWQLEMAKIIVELVKNGVKVLVNSHSPYMIEALKRYSDISGIEDKTNFYLAEDGYIKQENNSNSETLAKIFEKLSEPFETFEEMDSKRMEKLVNG